MLIHSLSGHLDIASPSVAAARMDLLHPPYHPHEEHLSTCPHVNRLVAAERQGCVADCVEVTEVSLQITADATVAKLDAPEIFSSRDTSPELPGLIVETREVPVYYVGSLLDVYA